MNPPPAAFVSGPGPEGRPALVLLHGLASSPSEFGLLTHPLRRLGIALHAPHIPGYSHPTLDARPRWQAWADAAHDAIDGAVPPGHPYVLGGLCTGALLALAVAARRRGDDLRGLVLLSPTFVLDGWGLPWWYGLRRIAYALRIDGHFSMHERAPYGLKNERLRTWVRQQMEAGQESLAGPPRVPLRAVHESERLAQQARGWLRALELPTLALHAREDEISSLGAVLGVLSTAPTDLLEVCVLENSYHMIAADNDRQHVAERLAAHVHACAAQPTAALAA